MASGIIGPSQKRFKNPVPNPSRRNFDQSSRNLKGWSPTRTENNHNILIPPAGNIRLLDQFHGRYGKVMFSTHMLRLSISHGFLEP